MTTVPRIELTGLAARRGALLLVFGLLLLFLTSGCGSSADEQVDKDQKAKRGLATVTGERARNQNLRRDGFTVEAMDLNRDEVPDQWTIKDASSTKRIERDLNFDGQVDLWQYPGPDGSLSEEEMDLDLDGKVDVVVHYENGLVVRKELSVDFEGTFSIIKFYDQQGELLRVERDEDGDGDIDVWEYYEKKQRVRIGWDSDQDGQPDRYDTF